jgi:hypothetical protein
MVKKITDHLTANKELFESTVLFITMDEGGGYYDSGYIQPIDFFGEGPRIPLIAVSPFTRGGHVSHTYADHVSILKFIERNWNLKPLTHRSRDNFPNPVAKEDNPYVPLNSPAIAISSICSTSDTTTAMITGATTKNRCVPKPGKGRPCGRPFPFASGLFMKSMLSTPSITATSYGRAECAETSQDWANGETTWPRVLGEE